MMERTAQELQQIIGKYAEVFADLTEKEFSQKTRPDKWSRKEVVGHLIDSAQNNLRRFICGQYETTPPHIIYEQEFWVKANGYGNMNSHDVIHLWKLINLQICTVLRSMPATNHTRECDTGRGTESLHSLEWLAKDYVKHLKHHINQVIPGSFNITYP
jgi:hypothetical protein